MRPEDADMVASDWKHCYKRNGDWPPYCDRYFVHQDAVIAQLLPASTVLVAHDPEDADNAFGWICFSGGALHFCYVRKMFRLEGVMSRLLEASGLADNCEVTHWTRAATRLFEGGKVAWRYRPLWLIQEAA